ncbi:NifU family protein [Candidatus Peregrinibacteria bacterium]|nr:NifU family protein [Candidatus Peregrinibacteria bacterium]
MKANKSAAKKAPVKAKSDLFRRISKCIAEKVRPFIQMDGGEIELIELTKDKILKVRLQGACQGCPMASITLSQGVQSAIDEEFPDEDIQILLVE